MPDCSTRNVVELCMSKTMLWNGVLEARWRCLLAHCILHCNPMIAGKIVNACAVLHNIANAHNVPIPQFNAIDQQAIQHGQLNHDVGDIADADVRGILVQRLWVARLHNE